LRPFQEFLRVESSAGILLLICTAVALAWANSPHGSSYFELARAPVTVGLGPFVLSKPLLLWINDGLMAIFFFVVGLEIKREILVGELSSPRKAVLPIVAALGGMIVPAAIYLSLNAGTEATKGWGIPVATDIAFAIGALTLLGRRVPLGLKVFLTALAIADDLGAVLVITVFYTSELDVAALGAAMMFVVLLGLANWAGVRHPLLYGLLGLGLWLAVFQSGVHPTVAGVLLAMTIPSRSRIDSLDFLSRCRAYLDEFERHQQPGRQMLTDADQEAALHAIETSCEQATPPLQRIEHALHPWVMYLIMPVFAFFNAAVVFEGGLWSTLRHPATLGVMLGLVIGKPAGITLFSWLAVRFKIAVLPYKVHWRHMLGVACLGGIGFTMSLFIGGLAFDGASLASVKTGILFASATAGVIGWSILRVGPETGQTR
jgi:NhaA family Na+:H+ antiporter